MVATVAVPAAVRWLVPSVGGDCMLGYHVSVYRQAFARSTPAREDSEYGPRLAVWQGYAVLGWIDELADTADGVSLGGDGYPLRYTARASAVIPVVLAGPPGANEVWSFGPTDIIDFSKWPGRTTVDQEAIASCDPDEWLLIEAWDES